MECDRSRLTYLDTQRQLGIDGEKLSRCNVSPEERGGALAHCDAINTETAYSAQVDRPPAQHFRWGPALTLRGLGVLLATEPTSLSSSVSRPTGG